LQYYRGDGKNDGNAVGMWKAHGNYCHSGLLHGRCKITIVYGLSVDVA